MKLAQGRKLFIAILMLSLFGLMACSGSDHDKSENCHDGVYGEGDSAVKCDYSCVDGYGCLDQYDCVTKFVDDEHYCYNFENKTWESLRRCDSAGFCSSDGDYTPCNGKTIHCDNGCDDKTGCKSSL